MRTFALDLDDYLARTGLEPEIARCQPAVGQVVERYDLRGKSIVSIGAGTAHEEIGMLRAGAERVVVYDIDEHGGLAQLLPGIRPAVNAPSRLTFHLCDFTRHELSAEDRYDVVYFSGFTPDELHRNSRSRPWRMAFNVVRRCTPGLGRQWLRLADESWPPLANPLHPVVRRAVQMLLKPGGIVLLQSYCGGVDVMSNPRFVRAVDRVFGELDVDLAEGHCFRSATAVVLWAGVRRPSQDAIQALRGRAPLTRFHGRSELGADGVDRFFVHSSLQSSVASTATSAKRQRAA